MNVYKLAVERILSMADVQPGGGRPWDIVVHDERFYRRALLEGAMGLGESYMDGWWDCADLEGLVFRFIDRGIERTARVVPSFLTMGAAAKLTNRQPRSLGKRTAEHYNTDNELFSAFLGKYKNYSCAYYEGDDDLDAAQLRKMDIIGERLALRPGDKVLDIGGGWGEIARHMATKFGVHVTSVNISDEQIRYARERCKGVSVDVLKCDYRDIQGTFDKISIIAMLSHVGPKNYPSFLRIVHEHLRPGGLVFIDTVGSHVSLQHGNPWLDKYIFPGITFPSITQMGAAIEDIFIVEEIRNTGPAYTKTLRAWNDNFQSAWPELSARHTERTRRMFEFFFLTVAGFFRARDFQNWYLLLSRAGTTAP